MNAPARELVNVQVLGPSDLPECIELARESFDAFHGDASAVLEWFEARVLGNPWQAALPGIGVGVREEGRLVAYRAMFAQPWWCEESAIVAAFAAHTAVHSSLRGQGIGTRLIEASKAFAHITGSTTAGNITQRVYAKAGFKAIGGADNGFHRMRTSYRGSLASRFGPKLGHVLGRCMDLRLRWHAPWPASGGGVELRPVDHCGAEVDRLWYRVRAFERSCLERSARYLQWRLFEQPTCALQAHGLYDKTRELRALAVWTVIDYSPQVKVAVLRDAIWPAPDAEALVHLLGRLLAVWRHQGLSWASFEVSSPVLQDCYRHGGAVALPSNGNRYQIHAAAPLAQATLDHWFRSGLDGDYFDTRSQEMPR